MQSNAYSPYALKDLYQAIDLIDRKIAYNQTFEVFASEEDRAGHLRKLSTKRAALVKSAQVLTRLGVSCSPQFLPRSFIHPVQDAVADLPVRKARKDSVKLEKVASGSRRKRNAS